MGYNVTPSAVRTTNNRNYVNSQAISSSITNLNLEKPIVDPNLVRGFRGLLTTFVSSMGAMNGVDNPWYSHVEKDWIREIVKPSASVAAGSTAGASVNVTLLLDTFRTSLTLLLLNTSSLLQAQLTFLR